MAKVERVIEQSEYCDRCGDPLPVDRQCDCAGDVDRDRIMALTGLRTNRVYTHKGMRRLYRPIEQ